VSTPKLTEAQRRDLRRCRETGDVALGVKHGWLRRVGHKRKGFRVTDAGLAALRGGGEDTLDTCVVLSAPKLTENEWRIINDALGWIEAYGDESEFHQTCTSHEVRYLRKAHEKIRAALRGESGSRNAIKVSK
jgi:hypothetical protein